MTDRPNISLTDLYEQCMAAIELIGRTGATQLEFGYLHDDVPADQADWWATATYRGAKVTVEHKRSPVYALDALLARLLNGAICRWCGRHVTNRESASPRRCCIYRRQGPRYVRGCTDTHDEPTVPIPDWAGRRYHRWPPPGRQETGGAGA